MLRPVFVRTMAQMHTVTRSSNLLASNTRAYLGYMGRTFATASKVESPAAQPAGQSMSSAQIQPAASSTVRTPVRSAQLRAQRPRAAPLPSLGTTAPAAASAAPDSSSSLSSSASAASAAAHLAALRAATADPALDPSCGPAQSTETEMVSVVNEKTGERRGPRGLEPTRYGDWEAKGQSTGVDQNTHNDEA
jgi:hypothetical protein